MADHRNNGGAAASEVLLLASPLGKVGIGEGGSPNNADSQGAYTRQGDALEVGVPHSFSSLLPWEADGVDVGGDGCGVATNNYVQQETSKFKTIPLEYQLEVRSSAGGVVVELPEKQLEVGGVIIDDMSPITPDDQFILPWSWGRQGVLPGLSLEEAREEYQECFSPNRPWSKAWGGYDIAKPVRGCRAGELAAVMKCDKCGKVVYSPVGCCNNALCPECRSFYAKRKAVEATRRLEDWGLGRLSSSDEKRWGFPRFEFTVPDTKWEFFDSWSNIRRFMKVVRDVLARWYRLRVGGVMTVHTWGSEEFWTWKPHIPVLISGLGYDEDKGFVRLRLKRKIWELNYLRDIYTQAMCAEFGWPIESIPMDKKGHRRLDVNYGWCGGVESLAFRLGYMFRSPSPRRKLQGWRAMEGLNSTQILGVARHFYFLRGFRRIVWFGFFGNRKGKWLAAKLGVEYRQWKEKLDYWACPYCGGQLIIQGFKFVRSSAGRSPPPGLGSPRASPGVGTPEKCGVYTAQ